MLNKRVTARDFIGLHLNQIDSIHRYRVIQKGIYLLTLTRDLDKNRWNFKIDKNDIILSASRG